MKEIGDNWDKIKKVFNQGLYSSLYFSIATVSKDGSLMLGDRYQGIFFEGFPKNMSLNLRHEQRVCIMAVNSSKRFWFRSIFKGKFLSPPGVRLYGRAGEKREGTEHEIEQWRKNIRIFKRFKGYNLLWGGLAQVRDLFFDGFEPVKAGVMTQGMWFG